MEIVLIEIIISFILGIICGVVTGLLPGLHPNTVSLFSVSLASSFDPFIVAIFLVTTGVTNSFVIFIPSIILGAPEDDSVMSVLPGHKLLLEGRGFEAIYLSVVGGLGATFFSIGTLPLFIIIIPKIYTLIRPNTHWLLIFVATYMIFSEGKDSTKKHKKIFFALITFISAGILGYFALNYSQQSIFPLLTGLFGLPMLYTSWKQETNLPKSISFTREKLSRKFLLSSISIGSLSGIIAGLLPGIGSAQAAVLAQEATGTNETEDNTRSFLISIGGINTADIIYSILAILLIGNPRSGVAVAINQIIKLSPTDIIILLAVILFSSLIASFLTLRLGKFTILNIRKVNYSILCKIVFYFLWVLIFIFSGLSGIAIAFCAMLIGFLPQKLGIKRTHLMGSLMFITILFFIGI
jgi:putative membrane protein